VLGELRRFPGCQNTRYGGKGIPNLFTATVGFELDAPLGKGRGAKSTGAAEEASRLNHRASLLDAAHTAAESLLATLSAYWSLSAAQERLELLERAVQTEEELHELAVALVEGDQLPRADLARVEARVASARRSAAQGRQAVHEARITLAESIGLAVDDPKESPLALDPLPRAAAASELEAVVARGLIQGAVERRADVEAARILNEAAAVLLDAAELDLKRRVDLKLSAGYRGFHESCREADPLLSEECLEFWDPQGLYEALKFDRNGFEVDFLLDFDIPFANRVAKGQLEQALAQARQSEIEARNLEREVTLSVAELIGSLKRAAAELKRREASTGYYEQTLENAMELFRAGEGTLIDTILTEEQLTSSRLAVVNAKLAYAAIQAELRFAMGALISHREAEGRIIIEGFHPHGLEFPL
jgi:outer membrane protein TolC